MAVVTPQCTLTVVAKMLKSSQRVAAIEQSVIEHKMVSMNKRFLAIFFVIQTVGQIAYWMWPLFPSSVGMMLWGSQLILLFPGNIVSGELVEALFWKKTTLTLMGVFEIPVTLAINYLLWSGLYLFAVSMLKRAGSTSFK